MTKSGQFSLILLEKNINMNAPTIAFVSLKQSDSVQIVDLRKSKVRRASSDREVYQFRNKSRVCIFRDKPIISNALDLIGGQKKFTCRKHKLSTDYKGTRFYCNFEKVNCKRKSKWRCPQDGCSVALCTLHYNTLPSQMVQAREDFSDRADQNSVQTSTSDDDSVGSHQDEAVENDQSSMFDGPTNSYAENYFCDTNGGQEAQEVQYTEKNREDRDLKTVPGQVLLNTIMSVLSRKKSTITGSKKYQRFFQNFAATTQDCSIALFAPEALLFPSIFYKQLEDKSYPGAIPFFLYADEQDCAKIGFHSLWHHLRLRLKDVTLPTCGSVAYKQYAADAVVNLNLKRHHTKEFAHRGIQCLEKDGQQQETKFKDLTQFAADTLCRVNDLVTALRKDIVKLFVTLTCNLKNHPGIAPILEAIEKAFAKCTDEERFAALESYMTTILTAWSRTIQHFIDYLSSDKLLGTIYKIWVRAEFQTTKGNLPRYHILIWCLETIEELQQLIDSSEKSLFAAFENLFHSNLQLIETREEMEKLFDESVKMHTHDCSVANYRCLKRENSSGNKVCRFPPNPNQTVIGF